MDPGPISEPADSTFSPSPLPQPLENTVALTVQPGPYQPVSLAWRTTPSTSLSLAVSEGNPHCLFGFWSMIPIRHREMTALRETNTSTETFLEFLERSYGCHMGQSLDPKEDEVQNHSVLHTLTSVHPRAFFFL